MGAVALVAAGLWPIFALARLAAGAGKATYLWGDQALLELGARRAWHMDQLVGPYSRFGWHHPGPVLFYLLALPVRVFGSHGPGLYAGTVIINGAASVATVALVWRRCSAPAALWTALAINALCLSLSMGFLLYPWNPNLVVVPTVLFSVLCADALGGKGTSLVWAAVVGSYLAQTHISAAPFSASMIVVTSVVWGLHRLRRAPGSASSPRQRLTAGLGVATFSLIWAPPVVELWRDHPNNLSLLWHFLRATQSHPGLGSAVRASLGALTILPLGYDFSGAYLIRSYAALAAGCAGMLVVVAAAFILARRRHEGLAARVAATGVIGAVVGLAATTRASGGLYEYLVVWQAAVPCMLLIAVGIALVGRPLPPPRGRLVGVTLSVVALLAAAITVRGVMKVPSPSTSNPVVATLSTAAQRVLRSPDHRVEVVIGTPAVWPDAAGLVLELERDGRRTTISPSSWVVLFGHERLADRPADATFDLYQQSDRQAAKDLSGSVVVATGGEVLAYRRTPSQPLG